MKSYTTFPYIAKTVNLEHPYVTAGNQVYVVGTQDGLFPDMGWHIPGEMGGVWNHPIKWLDGFYVGLEGEWGTVWPKATEFRTFPFYTEHHYHSNDWRLVRRQFVPDDMDALVITLEFTNLSCAVSRSRLHFVVKSDLRPGWLGTELDGVDVAVAASDCVIITDTENPWTVCTASSAGDATFHLGDSGCPYQVQGSGTSVTVCVERELRPGDSCVVDFYVTGSTDGRMEAEATLQSLRVSSESLFAAKAARYFGIDTTTAISLPDKQLEEAIRWVKYNTDWLVRKVPHIGNGLGAGVPDYPWWFGCDTGYALLGALPLGMFDVCKDTLRLLVQWSEQVNGDGRIIHEVSSTGTVFHLGNVQETPQFCAAVWETFRWTGDMDFLREMYPFVAKAISWVTAQAVDGDDLACGYGIIEVDGVTGKLIDIAVHTYNALTAYAQMAAVLGDVRLADDLQERIRRLKDTIVNKYWLADEGLFADILVDDIAYSLKHWIVNTPLEAGMAPPELGEQALARMREPDFRGPHGLHLCAEDPQHTMTISTSVQAVAECRYGHPEEAVAWLRLMAGTKDKVMPGSMCEMSPDYGCFVQAWTVYGMIYPIVCQMFGVSPMSHERRCRIDLNLPSTWGEVSVRGLRMGDNAVTLRYLRVCGHQRLVIFSQEAWTFEIGAEITIDDVIHGDVYRTGSTIKLAAGTEVTLVIAS